MKKLSLSIKIYIGDVVSNPLNTDTRFLILNASVEK